MNLEKCQNRQFLPFLNRVTLPEVSGFHFFPPRKTNVFSCRFIDAIVTLNFNFFGINKNSEKMTLEKCQNRQFLQFLNRVTLPEVSGFHFFPPRKTNDFSCRFIDAIVTLNFNFFGIKKTRKKWLSKSVRTTIFYNA